MTTTDNDPVRIVRVATSWLAAVTTQLEIGSDASAALALLEQSLERLETVLCGPSMLRADTPSRSSGAGPS